MSEKELLLKTINEKKAQLASARKGSEGWNTGRARTAGVSQVSKLSTQALEKEIKSLSEELRVLQQAK